MAVGIALRKPETRLKMSRSAKLKSITDEIRANLLAAARKPKSLEHRKRIGLANRGKLRPYHRGQNNPACQPGVLQKILAATQIKPNRSEMQFFDFLNQHFPGQFKYVGDGSLILGYKCPDFLFYHGPLLIEYWGDYWHRNDSQERRRGHFRKFGYETEFIKESEFKDDPTLVIKKIRHFIISYGYEPLPGVALGL